MARVPERPVMTKHPQVEAWVSETAELCQPDQLMWCDGSPAEYQTMLQRLVDAGSAMWLNDQKRPNSIYVRSDPADVARDRKSVV